MEEPEREQKIPEKLKIMLIGGSAALVFYIVFATNGTQNVYLHLIYIPIILSAYFWGIKGGLSVAILAGILAGPFMPLNISEGIRQSTGNWITRLIILGIVGSITGALFQKIEKLNNEIHRRGLISPLTGIYNINKLLGDLKKKIDKGDKFKIISIKLTNLVGVGKYVEHKFAETVIKELITELERGYGRDALYSFGEDEIIVIDRTGRGNLKTIENVLEKYSTAVQIENITFRVSLKVGVYEYEGGSETPVQVFNKARIAYEQGEEFESGIYYYLSQLEDRKREFFEISGSLLESISRDELYLVYQPKIDLSDNTISDVEALIRWDRGDRKPVAPDVFVKIAEDIGFIKELSKFVLRNATDQMVKWEKMGIEIGCSINITARELLDDDFNEWAKREIAGKKIDRSTIEIEITERVVSSGNKKILDILHAMRGNGYKVSIDDFGTGYNSLMTIGEIPFDFLKIDKYFIDRIGRREIRELVKNIINYAHGLNKEIVAEGVETEDELHVLRELECDRVQGYYYSKPLLPEEFETFYFEFLGAKG
ncbi:EAL domain-containing protein [Aminivibrio sp.]|uniref:EAL domain-containing protein n=1 Tax=Aminivibrio sp. TaxID=1872489 RepID=UPI00345EFDBC